MVDNSGMSLFQRRDSSDEKPLYQTVDNMDVFSNALTSKPLLIVGLGNIGKEYDNTRHNIGFTVADYFAFKNKFEDWAAKKNLHCMQSSGIVGKRKAILCKPTTLMNDSGKAVAAAQKFYKITNADTLVIYDEMDIDFGQIRTRTGGGAAGHNGVKSLISHCQEGFGRIRIGIGPKKPAQMDSADFVLSRFNKAQEKDLPLLLAESNSILSEHCFSNNPLPSETRRFII